MIKYVYVVSTVLLWLSFLSNTSARSATTPQYQHLNGLASTQSHENDESVDGHTVASIGVNNVWKDLSMVYKIYQQCATDNLSVCLKVKLLAGLERVCRATSNLKIVEGVQFVSSNADAAEKRDELKSSLPSEKDIEATLPRATDAKENVLNNMLFKKIATFLQDHTLQIKFPDIRNADAFANNDAEGRGKKKYKKGGGAYIMIPLLLGGTFVPIAYGALAMLAGKALIVSKLALVLASIIGIKKLLSGGGKESSHEVVVSGGNSGWGRDMDLAYSNWKPGSKQEPSKAL